MKKLSFVSNLIYALKKRFGWCPEPPTVKTEGIGKLALSKGILYTEKPLSPYFLIGILFVAIIPIGLSLFIWSYPMSMGVRISATLLIGIIFLIIWGALTIPSIRHRELSLTEEKLHVRLGPSEENISIYDIISIEPVEKPEIIWGELIGTGYRSAGWMILPFGVALEKSGVKWYVFGAGRTYFKIKRKSGNPVCVGVTNSNEFLEKWRMLQTRIIASQIQKLQKSYSYITTQKDGDPRIKPYVWEAEYNLYKKLFKVDEGYAKVLVDEQKPHIHLVTTFPEENERAKLRKIWIELFKEHYPEKLADFEPKNEHNSLNR